MEKLLSMAFPILPGKTEEWKEFTRELNGPRYKEFHESREKAGVHERVFFQSTLFGDIAIVTLSGTNPQQAFQQFGTKNDPFTQWFSMKVRDIHGIDLSDPLSIPVPEMTVDSETKELTRHPH